MTESVRPPLEIIPLGGLGEFGLNMMVIGMGDTCFVVDVGVMFPDSELLGVDLVIPDRDGFQILEELKQSEQLDTIPVIVITSKDLSEAEKERL